MIYKRPRYDLAKTHARSGRFIVHQQSTLFVHDLIPDGAIASVVFIHGIPTWSFLWRNVAHEVGQEFRAIALDLPGFGLSAVDRYGDDGVLTMASAAETVLKETIRDNSPIYLAVHDFGALVAAEIIARNDARVSGLIVLNSSLQQSSWSGGAGLLRILSIPYLGQMSMMLARPWMLREAMRPFISDDVLKHPQRFGGYWYPFHAGFGQNLARMYQHLLMDAEQFSRWRSALAMWDRPSLVLWGMRDPVFGVDDRDDLTSLLRRSTVRRFVNGNHFLAEERPRAVGRQIREFVRGVVD
jgi:pimeloyl-ACP methyl ester carboxylesterase